MVGAGVGSSDVCFGSWQAQPEVNVAADCFCALVLQLGEYAAKVVLSISCCVERCLHRLLIPQLVIGSDTCFPAGRFAVYNIYSH